MRRFARLHILCLLLTAFVLCTSMPCELLEQAGIPVCAEWNASACGEADGDPSGTQGSRCCAACLTCCFVSLQPDIAGFSAPVGSVDVPLYDDTGRQPDRNLPVWHPPRA